MLTSVWTLLKQGWKSLKEAVEYIRKPENKGKPIGRLMLETGKIVIAGLTAFNAIALGQVIEKGLMAVPPFSFSIPLIIVSELSLNFKIIEVSTVLFIGSFSLLIFLLY